MAAIWPCSTIGHHSVPTRKCARSQKASLDVAVEAEKHLGAVLVDLDLRLGARVEGRGAKVRARGAAESVALGAVAAGGGGLRDHFLDPGGLGLLELLEAARAVLAGALLAAVRGAAVCRGRGRGAILLVQESVIILDVIVVVEIVGHELPGLLLVLRVASQLERGGVGGVAGLAADHSAIGLRLVHKTGEEQLAAQFVGHVSSASELE
mmetsp:Transcript_2214/g.5074  ORF Transcript_2214/g.5074 Transcript_2214/m.5074 type:complete len:209 (+) Transcript_2214:230-856(+)